MFGQEKRTGVGILTVLLVVGCVVCGNAMAQRAVTRPGRNILSARGIVTRDARIAMGPKITLQATNVRAFVRGRAVVLRFSYFVRDRNNPTARVQLFVGTRHRMLTCVYNGVPGSSGDSGTASVTLPRSVFAGGQRVHFMGTWAYSVSQARSIYESGRGGAHLGLIAYER